jgi:homoserine O-acetyltransferase
MQFPVITIRDMVNVQKALIDYLGIPSLAAVAGGSMGGMQALQWSVTHPERVRSVVAIAATHQHSPQQIAFNEVARQAIMADPEWNSGNYYGRETPRLGLAVARMIGHVTYLSDAGMRQKFGRKLQHRNYFAYDFETDFEVESYLRHQGRRFVERFDANSLLYLTKALDYFDLTDDHASLSAAMSQAKARFLLLGFSSDWLYPAYQMQELAEALSSAGKQAELHVLESDYGHDAFLLEHERQGALVKDFLASR